MRITYHVAASADGFIARPDGDVAWLEQADIDMEQTGLLEFMQVVDGIVMGRKTYDFVHAYGSWPYGQTPAWICTRGTFPRLPQATLYPATTAQQVIDEARNHPCEHLWLVGGGRLASAFLESNFISEVCITELPLRLSKGIPLFARHRLEDLPVARRQVIERVGFRRIELQLRSDG